MAAGDGLNGAVDLAGVGGADGGDVEGEWTCGLLRVRANRNQREEQTGEADGGLHGSIVSCATRSAILAAGDGAEDDEGFFAFENGGGEGCIGGLVGDVFHVGEEAQEGAAFEGDVVADGAAELGVEGFEGVEGLGECGGVGDVEGDLVAADVGVGWRRWSGSSMRMKGIRTVLPTLRKAYLRAKALLTPSRL